MSDPLLEIKNLVTGFETESGLLKAVDGVTFSIEKGRTMGLVGESGCGKSVTAMSIVRLLPQPMGKILDGQILFKGRDLVQAKETDMHGIRGRHIGVIFQEPMTALNPVHSIGRQIGESLMLHRGMNTREARDAAIQLLQRVRIPAPEQRVDEFPHQLSGGMRQRVVIAIALACHPELIIADEPTTALDVTVQAQILSLLKDLQAEMGSSSILITHDLGVIAQSCDSVVVMYAGRVVDRFSYLQTQSGQSYDTYSFPCGKTNTGFFRKHYFCTDFPFISHVRIISRVFDHRADYTLSVLLCTAHRQFDFFAVR